METVTPSSILLYSVTVWHKRLRKPREKRKTYFIALRLMKAINNDGCWTRDVLLCAPWLMASLAMHDVKRVTKKTEQTMRAPRILGLQLHFQKYFALMSLNVYYHVARSTDFVSNFAIFSVVFLCFYLFKFVLYYLFGYFVTYTHTHTCCFIRNS